MSEYTNYYAVRLSDKHDVRKKLCEAKIYSIVEADEDQSWFLDNFKSNKPYEWVTFGCLDGGDIRQLCGLFDEFIHFDEDEDKLRWDLKLYSKGRTIEFRFDEDKESIFPDAVQEILSGFFNEKFSKMKPYLKYGKGNEFLNSLGIPYVDMFDQGLLRPYLFEEEYSIFAGDADD